MDYFSIRDYTQNKNLVITEDTIYETDADCFQQLYARKKRGNKYVRRNSDNSQKDMLIHDFEVWNV